MAIAISVQNLNKIYVNKFVALDNVNLEVNTGEILALLGPNGAGKTTLISSICGIIKITSGNIKIFGADNIKDYRLARSRIGLVPQELTMDTFETVYNSVVFSRGLFGKAKNPAYITEILKKLSLWDKKDAQVRTLSGGMKRRVMIAKALSHKPDILFLDEPTAGVDVALRKSMWAIISELRDMGMTTILTTHYIEEAEELADRIGIINHGKIIVVEEKKSLMKKLGTKELIINLHQPLNQNALDDLKLNIKIDQEGKKLIYNYDPAKNDSAVEDLLDNLRSKSIRYKDISTHQSSLEDIFLQLVEK